MQCFGLWLHSLICMWALPREPAKLLGNLSWLWACIFFGPLSELLIWQNREATNYGRSFIRVVRGRICKPENAGHCACFCFSPSQRQLPIGCHSRLEIFMAQTWDSLWAVYSGYLWALLLTCGYCSYEGTWVYICVLCSALWILAVSGYIHRRQKRRCSRVCGHGWDHYFRLVHGLSSVSGMRTAAGHPWTCYSLHFSTANYFKSCTHFLKRNFSFYWFPSTNERSKQ